jgi:hypothetical protein
VISEEPEAAACQCTDLKARIGKRFPHASCSGSFHRQTRSLSIRIPFHAHHQDVLTSNLNSESYRTMFAGPKPNPEISGPVSISELYSSRMDLRSDSQQLDGTVSPSMGNGTGIPLIRRIHSHEDMPGEDVKIGDQKCNKLALVQSQTPTNGVQVTEHAVGKTTEGSVQLSLQSGNSFVVCQLFSCQF